MTSISTSGMISNSASSRKSSKTSISSDSLQKLRVNPDWAKLPLFDRKGWKRVRFGDVVRQLKEQVDPVAAGIERYVAGEHMETENVHIRKWGTVGDGYLGPAFIRGFRKGQVLYGSRRTYLKKVAVAEWDGVTANTTFVLETVDGKLLQELLPWIMLSDRFTKHSVQESKGSTNPYINFPDIAKFEFDLPPLDQQRRLAEILWAVDDALEAHDRLEMSAVCSRMTLLRETFKDRIDYPLCRVEDAGDVQLGQQRHPKFQTGESSRPYLRVANVMDDYFDYTDVFSMDFADGELEKFLLKSGDILLNEGQSLELVGRCAMYDGAIPECCFQKTLLRFRSEDSVEPEWALGYFQFCQHYGVFASISSQTTSVAHLTAVRFKALPFPSPGKSVQRNFAERYRSIRSTLRSIRKHGERLKAVRTKLLDEWTT